MATEQAWAFRLLIGYRWISLLPPILWVASSSLSTAFLTPLLVAVFLTLLLTLTARTINRLLLHHPWLLISDLAVSALLVGYTGLEQSPFYLYSLAPILAGAFFFQIRGGLVAAGIYTLLYLPLLLLSWQRQAEALNGPLALAQTISFFLIGFTFGYPSQLLHRLRETHEQLAKATREMLQRNRDLHLLDELTLIMQSSVDLVQLQEAILHGLVSEMGYRRAAVGLYDEGRHVLTGWLTMENLPAAAGPQRLAHTEIIPMKDETGSLAQALRTRQTIEVFDGSPPTALRSLNKRLVAGRHYLILPLALRENPLGVILVDHLPVDSPLGAADRASLERLAAHAGVTMGSVRLCITRAHREAVVQERIRIAADLHDSISQVLYGLAYGLDACIQLLPDDPGKVQQELSKLQPVVADAQAQMRTAIFDMWSDEIASDTFVARLHRHLHAISPASSQALRIELPGEFDRWDSALRHDLLRITQEAMTNAARHADAQRINVVISPNVETIEVRVEDDGHGFDPRQVDASTHLGLQTMSERVQRLHGSLDIHSEPEQGTIVTARIPIPARHPGKRPEETFTNGSS